MSGGDGLEALGGGCRGVRGLPERGQAGSDGVGFGLGSHCLGLHELHRDLPDGALALQQASHGLAGAAALVANQSGANFRQEVSITSQPFRYLEARTAFELLDKREHDWEVV